MKVSMFRGLKLMAAFALFSADFQSISKIPNGKSIPGSTWPALVIVSSPASAEKCSGALIGPKVILTAAHCVGDNKMVTVNGVSAICDTPDQPGICPQSLDLALCRAAQEVSISSKFERPSAESGWQKARPTITLTGFGLPKVGQLGIGKAQVIGRPSPVGCFTARGVAGGCPGDSGGAVFRNGGRGDILVGVMSSVPPRIGCNSTGKSTTNIVDLTAPPAQAFLKGFAKAHPDLMICGFNAPAQSCF